MSRVLAVLAVDVGGSGLRAERVEVSRGDQDGSRSRGDGDHQVSGTLGGFAGAGVSTTGQFEGAGAAITAGRIDLEALLADVRGFSSRHREPPDVVVWSMRGLLSLSDPGQVLKQVHSRLGAAQTVVANHGASIPVTIQMVCMEIIVRHLFYPKGTKSAKKRFRGGRGEHLRIGFSDRFNTEHAICL